MQNIDDLTGTVRKYRTDTGIQGHSGEYAPWRTRWKLDPDRIIEKLKTNRTFKVGMQFDINGLPIFADLIRYGVSEDQQLELFSLEIRRLVELVNSAKPIRLEGEADWFGEADKDGYGRLDKLATQMKLAIWICLHDLELHMLEHHPAEARADNFKEARESLLKNFGVNPLKDPMETWSNIRLGSFNDEAFHAVVNYVTGSIIQVLLRTMDGKFWDDNCIITMAKCTAKIKVVALDLVHAAETSLAGKREWMRNLQSIIEQEPNPPPAEQEMTAVGNQLQAMARCVVLREQRYFEVMHAFGGVLVLLRIVAETICSDQGTALPPDVFESSSLIYDTGFLGQRNLLTQERNSTIGISGNNNEVHCANFAFDVCLRAFEDLKLRSGSQTTKHTKTSGPSTLVYWKWTGMDLDKDNVKRGSHIFKGEPRTGKLRLSSMHDIITAFVPYAMVSGRFAAGLASMTQLVMSISVPGDPLSMCEPTRFLAFFMIQTSEHSIFKQKIFGEDPDVTPVSTCPIAQERTLAEGPMSLLPQSQASLDDRLRSHFVQKNMKLSAGLDMMAQWTLDNSSIIIRSRWYCWGTLTCCATLVAGGLIIGFTVNKRIDGVDPFNISIFCWALAGFIIIFMKSLRVENWPWRDFFRGRVVCRSVSEVAAVSGIDEQLLLSILLHQEPQVVMNKEGPHRAIFIRKDENTAGFSIDVPFKRETLVDAGCFFVKVQSSKGPALVVIRATKNWSYNMVEPHSSSKEGSETKCPNYREPGKWGRGDNKKDIYYLNTNYLRWSRVVGIFWGDAYFY
jgi:hypothetical protein